MALSNWDTFALDKDGKSVVGRIISPLGIVIEIYKNWLYVRDERAWIDGGSFVEPTIMEIQEGIITYLDTKIYARRGPKYGIYCVVKCTDRSDKDYKKWIDTYMFGIGCSGFKGDRYVGVEPRDVEFLMRFVRRINRDHLFDDKTILTLDTSKGLRYNQGDGFFQDATGQKSTGTKPGEAEDPWLIQMLVGQKDVDIQE